MYISYYDEAGDDGLTNTSSKFFVLSALYLHHLEWENALDQLKALRRELKSSFGLPIAMEFHASIFLKNNEPFRRFNFSARQRLDIISTICDAVSKLKIQIVNVCIVKQLMKSSNYNVLDTALRYSILRIHNDLQTNNSTKNKFILITDDGRVGKMRKTTRRIRKFNMVPSQFKTSSIRVDINTLIEDPFSRDSSLSYFIQTSDLIAFVIYLYAHQVQGSTNEISNRIKGVVDGTVIVDWMKRLRPVFNTLATSHDPFGVVFHPK